MKIRARAEDAAQLHIAAPPLQDMLLPPDSYDPADLAAIRTSVPTTEVLRDNTYVFGLCLNDGLAYLGIAWTKTAGSSRSMPSIRFRSRWSCRRREERLSAGIWDVFRMICIIRRPRCSFTMSRM